MSQKIVIEKLRGRENYETWKISAKSYLTINGYWSCTTSTISSGSSADIVEKHAKALSELTLMLDPSIYSYIEGKESMKEAWEAIASAFSDSGTSRKVFLLQQWIGTKLNECSSMEEYVNKMTTSWARVKAVGFKIDEVVGASVMLAGLPSEYRPLILGIENNEDKLKMDTIKNLLLQGSIMEENPSSSAFLTQKNKYHGKQRKKVRCFKCGGPHFMRKCHKNNNENKSEAHALLCAMIAEGTSDSWFIDSGASVHMSRSDSIMNNIRAPNKDLSIKTANNQTIGVKAVGDVFARVDTKFGENSIVMKNVQYVPDLCTNLLSVAQIVQHGNEVVFNKNGCIIYNTNKKVIATADLINNMFRLNVSTDYAFSAKGDNIALWHKRMGHLSLSGLKQLKCDDIDMKLISKISNFNCITCAKGKHCREKFVDSTNHAKQILELIHSDVCGPMSCNSIGGSRYYVTFIDDFTRKIFVYVIKNKNQVYDCFLKFKNFVENQTSKKIKILRSDNGTEYVNSKFQTLCATSGIQHQKTCTYTPEQNGLAERFNRTIMERVRCLLFEAGLPKSFWGEAVLVATRIINASYNSATKGVPDEIWFDRPVDYSRFKTFGCQAMAHIPNQRRKKLDVKSTECIFIGYADDTKGYRLLDPSTQKVIISRDVLFFEDSKIQSPSFQNYIELPVLLRDRNNAKTGAREDVNDDSNTDESQTSSIHNNLTFGSPSSSGITTST